MIFRAVNICHLRKGVSMMKNVFWMKMAVCECTCLSFCTFAHFCILIFSNIKGYLHSIVSFDFCTRSFGLETFVTLRKGLSTMKNVFFDEKSCLLVWWAFCSTARFFIDIPFYISKKRFVCSVFHDFCKRFL